MTHVLKLSAKTLPNVVPKEIQVTYGGLITRFDKLSNSWIIDDVYSATCAVSLLIQPCVGDTVCFVEMAEEYYITQLLSRKNEIETLTISSDKKMHWQAPELKFTAFENLELISLDKMALMSKNCVMSVANTMIQQAENLLQKVGQYSLSAKGLLRVHGKHQVITAEKDVRIDAERINMG